MPMDPIQNLTGLFVPTTNIWEVQRLQEVDVQSEEFKELLVRLYQNINNIAVALNLKDSGYYDLTSFVNGQLFFPGTVIPNEYRQVLRLTINFGPLPNATTKSVPHGITINPNTTITRIYAAATSPSTTFIPIPYSSATLNKNIEIYMDPININITTAIDYSAYTICYIIVEYLQI